MTAKKRQKAGPGKSQAKRVSVSDFDLSRVALDAVEESVHVVDSALRIQVINRTFLEWCRKLGIDTGKMVGATVFEAFGFLPDRVREEYIQVFETGRPVTTEEAIRVENRDLITRTRKLPVMIGDTVTHVVTIVSDITEYKTARRELRASTEQYSRVMENVPSTIAVIDADGIFLYINSHGADRLGAPVREILGRRIGEYFPPDLADRHLQVIRQVIAENSGFSNTVRTRAGSRWGWFDVNVQPYTGVDGKVAAALLIINDITQYKDAIDALQESEERFRRQFQAIPLPTYIWEYEKGEFYLREHNRAAHAITRGLIEKYIGMTATEMYADRPEVARDMKQCLRRKKTIRKEMAYLFQSTGLERMLVVYYVYVPPNRILVHTEDITERRRSRDELQKAHDELELRVRERTEELATINQTLRVEREALKQKNIALNEVLAQIEDGKRQLGVQIQSNINRIALPILNSLENRVDPSGSQYIELLRSNLKDIAAPLTSELEKRFVDLTPRELEICHMIQKGLSCKDIAVTFNTALQTVLKQRSAIRKKLGIANKKINLESFLKSI